MLVFFKYSHEINEAVLFMLREKDQDVLELDEVELELEELEERSISFTLQKMLSIVPKQIKAKYNPLLSPYSRVRTKHISKYQRTPNPNVGESRING